MLNDIYERTQTAPASDRVGAHAVDFQSEIALELMGKGRFHFDLEVLRSEDAVRIHGHLVERSDGNAIQKAVCVTMTQGDAATLARKIAGKLGIVVLREVENRD